MRATGTALILVCCLWLFSPGSAHDTPPTEPYAASLSESDASQQMQALLQQAVDKHMQASTSVQQQHAPQDGGSDAFQHMQALLQQAMNKHVLVSGSTEQQQFAQDTLAAGDMTASISSSLDTADQVYTTSFRSQDELTTSDPSTEEYIPGLNPTDAAAVRRAIPNLEHWSPFLTMMMPFMPELRAFTNAIGFYLPISWPLAAVGPTGDWLRMYLGSYWRAFWGEGPRPPLAPTMLVANAEAYHKLPHQLARYSGLGPISKVLLTPIKGNLASLALYDQLTRNMMLPRAPAMNEAVNNTLIKTEDGVELRLVIKEDGRYLVSNTTTAKIVKEIFTGPPFPNTFVVVDSFIVPKIRLAPRPPPPLLTQEEIQQLPQLFEMLKDGLAEMPAAIAGMPAAVNEMLQQQWNLRHPTTWAQASAQASTGPTTTTTTTTTVHVQAEVLTPESGSVDASLMPYEAAGLQEPPPELEPTQTPQEWMPGHTTATKQGLKLGRGAALQLSVSSKTGNGGMK